MATEPRHGGELHRVRGLVDRDPLQEHSRRLAELEVGAGEVKAHEQQPLQGRIPTIDVVPPRTLRRSRRPPSPAPRRLRPATARGPQRPVPHPAGDAFLELVGDVAGAFAGRPCPLAPVDDPGQNRRVSGRVYSTTARSLGAGGLHGGSGEEAGVGSAAGHADRYALGQAPVDESVHGQPRLWGGLGEALGVEHGREHLGIEAAATWYRASRSGSRRAPRRRRRPRRCPRERPLGRPPRRPRSP